MIRAVLPPTERWYTRLWTAAEEFVFPPACPQCQQPRGQQPRGQRSHATANDSPLDRPRAVPVPELCDPCRQQLLVNQPAAACAACGGPVSVNHVPGDCQLCRHERFAFSTVLRLGLYREELRSACMRGKHAGNELLLSGLAGELFRAHEYRWNDLQPEVVVPVPQHWSRRFIRPVGPAESLAAALARCLRVPHCIDALKQTRYRPAQATLSPAIRRKNVSGTLACQQPHAVAGRRVLLVDDVLTTGATADAAARALKRAGATDVFVAVLARGVGDAR